MEYRKLMENRFLEFDKSKSEFEKNKKNVFHRALKLYLLLNF